MHIIRKDLELKMQLVAENKMRKGVNCHEAKPDRKDEERRQRERERG